MMSRIVEIGLPVSAVCFFVASMLAAALGEHVEAMEALQTGVLISVWICVRE